MQDPPELLMYDLHTPDQRKGRIKNAGFEILGGKNERETA